MAAKTDHALERMIFFSDAVFAIAITLLVIDLHPPELPRGASDAAHLHALARLMPNFVSFGVSFAVIGMFWMGHHRAFGLAGRYSPRMLGWNLGLLATIVFMPFAAAYLSSNIFQRVPAILYCLVMLAAALLNLKVNRTATGPLMADPNASPEALAYVRQRGTSVVLGAASAVALAFVMPGFCQAGLISIPFWRRFLTWRANRRSAVQA
jgi:uncharacterized membrane protein